MTWKIIAQGTEAFTPIIDKLGNIASEFIPYMLYIAIACASIRLMYEAVRFIIRYIKNRNFSAFYYRDYEWWKRRNGVFETTRRRKERKHIRRNRIRFFR